MTRAFSRNCADCFGPVGRQVHRSLIVGVIWRNTCVKLPRPTINGRRQQRQELTGQQRQAPLSLTPRELRSCLCANVNLSTPNIKLEN